MQTTAGRLQLLGRLCNISCVPICKTLFCASTSLYYSNTKKLYSLCGVLLSTAEKYNLLDHVFHYICTGEFPAKNKWRKIVVNEISNHEKEVWKYKLSCRADLSRYSKIHTALSPHILYSMTLLYPELRKELQYVIRIGSRSKISKECKNCNTFANDYCHHVILNCVHLLSERDVFFSSLIDYLDVETYVKIDMMEEHDMLAFFLGAKNNDVDEITWHFTVIEFSKYLYKLKDILNHVW